MKDDQLPLALPATVIKRYASHLRKVYLRTKLPIEEKWPPISSIPCKKVINLAVVERVQQPPSQTGLLRTASIDDYMTENKVTPISMEELLRPRDGSPPKIVIVQGVPGIGKSTFAWKFCRRWAKGKIYQQYDLVVLLRMRDTRVREAKTLTALFSSLNPFDEGLCDSTAKEVVSRGGKGVVFLFEGLDELPSSLLTSGHSLFIEILHGFLPEVTTVVTSRPWAVQKLLLLGSQFTSSVEILGFTKKDIIRYVSHAFSEEEKPEFLEYLYSHPQLESIMHIPLNAASIVHIYKHFKRSQQAVPQTLTQLYTALVKSLLLRYMKSIPEFSDYQLTNLQALPEPIKSHFQQLCLLAFMSFTKLTVQVIFSDSEAALYGCLDSLGLMQSSADLSIDTGTTVTHSFLHFTIQEFLAAYHLSNEPDEVQKLFLEVHQKEPQFEVIIRFLIGLNNNSMQHLGDLSTEMVTSKKLHWLFESQCPEAVSKYLGNIDSTFSPFFSSFKSPLDYYALTYSICYSNCRWDVLIDMSFLTAVFSPPEDQLSHYTGQITSLRIFNATSVGIQLLSLLPPRVFTHLHSLVLGSDQPSAYSALVQQVRCGLYPQLKDFSLTYYYSHTLLGNSSIGELTEAISITYSSLDAFAVCGCSFNPISILPLCAYISSPSCMSKLVLSEDSFEGDSLHLLISSLPCTKSLASLDISYTMLSLPDTELLSAALAANSSLTVLNISDCAIDGAGAEALADALECNVALQHLRLDSNNIDTRGAAALASMLTVNTTLKTIDLIGNPEIGAEGAMRLINALEQNKTLETLGLSSSCEPIEFRSVLMDDIRECQRVLFCA